MSLHALLIQAGWDDRETETIAAAVTDALDERPLARPDALAHVACTVLYAFNRPAADARAVIDGVLTAAADCICTFDELSRFIRSVSPITAALGKSMGTVLEGYVGLTMQNIEPSLAEQRICSDLRREWIARERGNA